MEFGLLGSGDDGKRVDFSSMEKITSEVFFLGNGIIWMSLSSAKCIDGAFVACVSQHCVIHQHYSLERCIGVSDLHLIKQLARIAIVCFNSHLPIELVSLRESSGGRLFTLVPM